MKNGVTFRLPSFFHHHMVLQRGKTIRALGSAETGREVAHELAGIQAEKELRLRAPMLEAAFEKWKKERSFHDLGNKEKSETGIDAIGTIGGGLR